MSSTSSGGREVCEATLDDIQTAVSFRNLFSSVIGHVSTTHYAPWASQLESMTSSQTVRKPSRRTPRNAADIELMIFWLVRNGLEIRFEDYAGRSRDQFVPFDSEIPRQVRAQGKPDGGFEC